MARFAFGAFVLDTQTRRLTRGAEPVVLTRKVLDTLVLLVEARGQVVDRETFLRTLWPDTVVEERNLTVNMSTLRRALSPEGGEDYVETVPKIGYRLIPPVTVIDAGGERPAAAVAPVPDGIAPGDPRRATPAPRPVDPPVAPGAPIRRWRWAVAAAALVLIVPATLLVLRQPSEATAAAGPAATPAAAVAVAVLPFVVTGDADNAAFGLGLADAVVAHLEAVPRIAVKRMREVAPYASANPIAIGGAVGADHVVEGVVQRRPEGARLRMRIIDVKAGETRWTEEFEQRDSNLFELQDVLAASITGSVLRRLTVERVWTRYRFPPSSADAYNAFLDARMFANRTAAGGDMRDAVAAYQRAIAIEPSFAPAWSGLARAYRYQSFRTGFDHDTMWALAYEATHRALSVDPDWVEGHQMLGMLKYSEWQWEEAERHLRKAVELDPENDDAMTWLANLLRGQARWDECVAIYQQARALNPMGATQTQQLGEVLWHGGRYVEALGMLAEAARLNPGNSTTPRLRAEVFDTIGNEAEALAARRAAAQLNRDREYLDTVLSQESRGYRAVREAEMALFGKRGNLWEVAVGLTYLGRHDEALDVLDRCITEKCGMSILIVTEPRLRALHASPRFPALAERVNLAHLLPLKLATTN